jgi:hypothetical protein
MKITATWADGNFAKYANRVTELHARLPKTLPRIVNQAGERARTATGRALAKQTGLPVSTARKALTLNVKRAHEGKLSYDVSVKGGDVRLQFFQPRETRKGVSAKPWGKRQVFAATFQRAGWWPDRVVSDKLSPHVWRRLDKAGKHFTQAKSGLFIPTEAAQGASGDAWTNTGLPVLQQRVEAAIAKLIP